ncbi:MAG: radical SAM protein [Candidatus Omnitrophota bacterium]
MITRKVLVIKPEYHFFPIGLAYVLATLEKNRIPFDFIDAAFESIDCEKWLRGRDYLAVATGGLVGDFPFFMELSKQLKRCGNQVPVILGGSITQCVKPEILFDHLGIDYALMGEAETSFAELLERLGKPGAAFDDLSGIIFRDKTTGSIQRRPSLKLDLERDDLEPAWHRIDMKPYLNSQHHSFPGKTFFPILTGRGCNGHCSFCSPTLGRFRARKIDNILSEMKRLDADYEFGLFGVMTEVLFSTEDEIVEFCRRYAEEGPKKEWFCSLRLDVAPSILAKMKAAGCMGVSVGAESGSDRILEGMKKGIDRKQILSFLREVKRIGMPYECNVMVGSEGETQEDLKQTFDMLIEAEMFSNINLTIAYPGTLIYRHAKEKGLITDEYAYLANLKYTDLADHEIARKSYLNLSAFPDTEALHNGIMLEVRRYLKFMEERFPCAPRLDLSRDSYEYSALCPVCGQRSEIGKDFGNWRWDGLVLRLVCRHCFNVSFSRIGSRTGFEKVAKELQAAHRVLVFGTGMNARSILAHGVPGLDLHKIIGFVDPYAVAKDNAKFFFYPQYGLDQMKDLKPDVVLVTDMPYQDALILKSKFGPSDEAQWIPFMPDVFPEKILGNKRVLLIGEGHSAAYLAEQLKTIRGCEIFAILGRQRKGEAIDSTPKKTLIRALFSKDWDIAVVSVGSPLKNTLWCAFLDLFLFWRKRLILGQRLHPFLSISLWLPVISTKITMAELKRMISPKLRKFIKKILPSALLEKIKNDEK